MSSQRNPSALWSLLRRHEAGLLLAIAIVVIATALLDTEHNYYHDATTSAGIIARQTVMLGIFALGAGVVIISGGIDLSSGSVIAFSGTIFATLLLLMAPEAMVKNQPLGWGVIALSIVGTLVIGFLIGTLHAWMITVVKLPPFVATLATLVGLRSLGRAICENVTEATIGGRSTQINVSDAGVRDLALSVWIPTTVFVVIAVAMWIMLSRTVVGRRLYALGGNEEAARLSGIRTDRLKWLAYCLSAVFSSIAGILYVADQTGADPQTLGRGYELDAIAAAVVGGCSLSGGVGTIPGIVLGALFLRIVIDGIAKIIDTNADVYQGIIVGVAVVLAVTFSQRKGSANRTAYFAGGQGIIIIGVLALLAGVTTAVMSTSSKSQWGLVASVVALGVLGVRKILERKNPGERPV